MEDNNLFSLKDALGQVLRKHKLENTINEERLKEAWAKTVGEYCQNHTEGIKFYNGELKVKISSSVVRQELLYAKTEIIEKINKKLENNLVKSIRFY